MNCFLSNLQVCAKVELTPRIRDRRVCVVGVLFELLLRRRVDLQQVAVVAAERALHRLVDLFGAKQSHAFVYVVMKCKAGFGKITLCTAFDRRWRGREGGRSSGGCWGRTTWAVYWDVDAAARAGVA